MSGFVWIVISPMPKSPIATRYCIVYCENNMEIGHRKRNAPIIIYNRMSHRNSVICSVAHCELPFCISCIPSYHYIYFPPVIYHSVMKIPYAGSRAGSKTRRKKMFEGSESLIPNSCDTHKYFNQCNLLIEYISKIAAHLHRSSYLMVNLWTIPQPPHQFFRRKFIVCVDASERGGRESAINFD